MDPYYLFHPEALVDVTEETRLKFSSVQAKAFLDSLSKCSSFFFLTLFSIQCFKFHKHKSSYVASQYPKKKSLICLFL